MSYTREPAEPCDEEYSIPEETLTLEERYIGACYTLEGKALFQGQHIVLPSHTVIRVGEPLRVIFQSETLTTSPVTGIRVVLGQDRVRRLLVFTSAEQFVLEPFFPFLEAGGEEFSPICDELLVSERRRIGPLFT